MGTGITAVIPLSFQVDDKNYFAKGFFDNFNMKNPRSGSHCVINDGILLKNYRLFLIEFYQLIEEDIKCATMLAPDEIPLANNLDEFYAGFDRNKRGGYVPHIKEERYGFSTLGCKIDAYWMFYIGSYKAILEVYCTLTHFERILSKAMKNPLAKSVKFGIFG